MPFLFRSRYLQNQMENNQSIADSFDDELVSISNNSLLDPRFRRKKLILRTIRTILTITLYVIFWKHEWLRWTLFLTIPLSLFNLFMITIYPLLLKKKIEKIRKRIYEAENLMSDSLEK
jgi:hypothetical protein